ncbi:MAG TPA: hypothetical protein DHN33_02030, partial [Eubacteriaceae bacterium]|nr:hypothetical protein [Eubacteriaceae bacterium]
MDQKKGIKLAILSVSSVLMIAMTASAIMADIYAAFPDADESLVQLVLTIPSLLGMIFSLISGPLSTKISKKHIVIFGLVSATLGGLLGLTLGKLSVYILIGASILIGVAQGINSTMTMALIADYFTGHERSTLMGFQSAFVNGGSMIILFISGQLAGIEWNLSYLVYVVMIPIILIVLKNLPTDSPVQDDSTYEGGNSDGKMKPIIYLNALVMFLFATMLFIFQANISVYLNVNELGGAAQAGMANSLMTGAGVITGLLYGRIRGALKSITMPIAILSVALGQFIIYSSSSSLTGILIAAFLIGLGMSLAVPTAIFVASVSVVPTKSAMAIALTNGCMNTGLFLSPFIINPIVNAIQPGDIGFRFLFGAVSLI